MVIKMRISKLALFLLGGSACISVGVQGAHAAFIPGSELLSDYLVIATGNGSSAGSRFESFSMSNVELGADQEVVSNSSVGNSPQRVGGAAGYNGGLDLTGVFVPNNGANAAFGGNRWNDVDPDHPNDTIPNPDRLPGARPMFEGIDFTGNVALTGSHSILHTSNTDTNASLGIRCTTAVSTCDNGGIGNSSYYDITAPDTRRNLGPDGGSVANEGMNQFSAGDRNALLVDLAATRDFIVGLQQEVLFAQSSFTTGDGLPFTTGEHTGSGSDFASAFVNRNIRDSNDVVVIDLDAIDANDDGFAVVDINAGDNAFNISNTDMILKSTQGVKAIFRLIGDTNNYMFANSSIMLGDGNANSTDVIDELGAIFFNDAISGTNSVFDLSNVILGGIGLWDFTDFNPSSGGLTRLYDAPGDGIGSTYTSRPGSLTKLNLQNSQGCAQFIGHEVDMSNNRWTRCEQVASGIPEPSTLLIFGFGLFGVEMVRRSQMAGRQSRI